MYKNKCSMFCKNIGSYRFVADFYTTYTQYPITVKFELLFRILSCKPNLKLKVQITSSIL